MIYYEVIRACYHPVTLHKINTYTSKIYAPFRLTPMIKCKSSHSKGVYTWYVYYLLVCVEEQCLGSLAPSRQGIHLTLK